MSEQNGLDDVKEVLSRRESLCEQLQQSRQVGLRDIVADRFEVVLLAFDDLRKYLHVVRADTHRGHRIFQLCDGRHSVRG